MVAYLRPAEERMRRMLRLDLPEVHAIESEAYEFGWTRGIFHDCMTAGHECWLLERGGEIVAYAVLAAWAEEAHLLNICVAPAWQGTGCAQRLLRRMLEVARWHDAARVLLEVRPSNAPALHIYRRFGFRVIGTRPRYYPARQGREDALVMALVLRAPRTE